MNRQYPDMSGSNSWNEICADENARLRANTVLFTGAASVFFLVMALVHLLDGQRQMLLLSGPLLAVTLILFILQACSGTYSVWIARTFGMVALVMAGYLLYSGWMGGYGFLWIFLLPNITVMVIGRRDYLIFEALLLGMLAVMLLTPLHTRLAYVYSPAFRTMFPLVMLFMSLCVSVAELMRHRMQRQLARTAETLRSYAYNDPLTGIHNRHALVLHYGDMNASARGLSFAIIDLDFFKDVNDRHGHLVGDEMLCHIVRLIQDACPEGARLCRWGGEEFLLVMCVCEEGIVQAILEAIRQRAEGTPMIVDGKPVRMTISLGGVCAAVGSTVGDCIAAADERLYAAKAHGRNCVEMAH